MDRIPIFKGRLVDLGIEKATLPNGREMELEILRHPGAAAIVPLHADGTVTLIRQFRYAAGGMITEIPAGHIDGYEVPDLCARRELKEEVGLEAKKLTRISIIHTTPGFTDERIYIFLAEELTDTGATPEEHEYLKPMRLPLSEALDMVYAGDITDAKTIVGLTMAARHLEQRQG